MRHRVTPLLQREEITCRLKRCITIIIVVIGITSRRHVARRQRCGRAEATTGAARERVADGSRARYRG